MKLPRLARLITSFALVGTGTVLAVTASTGCSSTLSQPFESLKQAPITIHRLQNFEPPTATAATPAAGGLQLPPQIQQWLGGAAAALPPGLIPPGLLPGTAPAAQANDGPKFYNFRILGSVNVVDKSMHDDILNLFGKEASFEPPRQSCMYAEFGFSIGQGMAPTVQGQPPTTGAADILTSVSCDTVQMPNGQWPYGGKTGLTKDSNAKIIAIARKAFGG